MNTVPASAASQPATGQRRNSILATKAEVATALTAKMSSQER